MQDIIRRFTSRKLLVTFMTLLGLGQVAQTDAGPWWVTILGTVVAAVYVLVQGLLDRSTVDQAAGAVIHGIDRGRQLSDVELRDEIEQLKLALDERRDAREAQGGFVRLRALLLTSLALVTVSVFALLALACSPKTWQAIFETRDLLCEEFADLAVDDGLATTDAERLAYLAACRRDPQVAVTAAEHAQAGEPIPRLSLPE